MRKTKKYISKKIYKYSRMEETREYVALTHEFLSVQDSKQNQPPHPTTHTH